MLADFGLDMHDTGIEQVIRKATAHTRDEMFAVRGRTPDVKQQRAELEAADPYADLWHVSPCNSPIITYSLECL